MVNLKVFVVESEGCYVSATQLITFPKISLKQMLAQSLPFNKFCFTTSYAKLIKQLITCVSCSGIFPAQTFPLSANTQLRCFSFSTHVDCCLVNLTFLLCILYIVKGVCFLFGKFQAQIFVYRASQLSSFSGLY